MHFPGTSQVLPVSFNAFPMHFPCISQALSMHFPDTSQAFRRLCPGTSLSFEKETCNSALTNHDSFIRTSSRNTDFFLYFCNIRLVVRTITWQLVAVMVVACLAQSTNSSKSRLIQQQGKHSHCERR